MTRASLPSRGRIDHSPGRPQRWPDVDQDIGEWIHGILGCLARPTWLAAIYLHGSLAMGCYHRPKSDLDLLIVSERPLEGAERRALATELLDQFDRRPVIGGLELSVVTREAATSFDHPMPYEFHFSESWAASMRDGSGGPRGRDRDLAAHLTSVLRRGIALSGPDPGALLGSVPPEAFLDAVNDDLRWIVDGGILESPFYGVLNLCRGLRQLNGQPPYPSSKEEGVEWALEHLPAQHRQIIEDALQCYRSAAVPPAHLRQVDGHSWDETALLAFSAYAKGALAIS